MGFGDSFKSLSDPVRRQILVMLRNGKMTAGDISKEFDMTDAAVSYHLKCLKKADFIRETKYKNFIYYELNTSVFDEILMWFTQFKGGNEDEK